MAVVDAMKALSPSSQGEPKLTYNKTHIALGTSGYTFGWFYPRKVASHCAVIIKVGATARQAIIDKLEEAGIDALSRGKGSIRLNVKLADIEVQKVALSQLLQKAEEWSHR
jgi:hypothetical protein